MLVSPIATKAIAVASPGLWGGFALLSAEPQLENKGDEQSQGCRGEPCAQRQLIEDARQELGKRLGRRAGVFRGSLLAFVRHDFSLTWQRPLGLELGASAVSRPIA